MQDTHSAMSTIPIPRLLWRNSVPLIFSLLAHSLYNFVDSVFISHVSEASLTALSMAAPVQALIGALGCGIAVGLNSAISKAMGEKDEKKVRQIASGALLLAVVSWLIISLVCYFWAEPYFLWQSGGDREITEAGVIYLRICLYFSLGTLGQWVYDRFLIATGRSTLFLITLTVASVINLILDPIFIFGWLGLPAMGTAGAAIATVIGQFGGAIAGIFLNERKNPEIVARFRLRIPPSILGEILRVGIPTAIMQGIVAITGILMNTILSSFSNTAVAVMGICSRIESLALLPPHGVNNALIPITAYNFGANRPDRVRQSIRWAYLYSFAMMAPVVLILELFPRQILQLFDASEKLYVLGIPAIRTLALGYFLTVSCLVGSTIFQALGKGNYSMHLTLTRRVFLPLLFSWLFSLTGNVNLVWWAFPLAEVITTPLNLILLKKSDREIVAPLA